MLALALELVPVPVVELPPDGAVVVPADPVPAAAVVVVLATAVGVELPPGVAYTAQGLVAVPVYWPVREAWKAGIGERLVWVFFVIDWEGKEVGRRMRGRRERREGKGGSGGVGR